MKPFLKKHLYTIYHQQEWNDKYQEHKGSDKYTGIYSRNPGYT